MELVIKAASAFLGSALGKASADRRFDRILAVAADESGKASKAHQPPIEPLIPS